MKHTQQPKHDGTERMQAIKPETIEKIARQQTGLKAAERAMMLEDTRRILAAENAVADAVHKRAFGEDYKPMDDDMGDIHVGDKIEYTPPPPATQQKDSGILLPIALATALLAPPVMGLAGAGLAYMMLKQPPPVVQDFEDGTVKLGLGRIEDYINKENK